MIFPDYLHIKSNIDFSSLPFFHAILNGCTGLLLFTGYVLIKNKNTKPQIFNDVTLCVIINIFDILCYFKKLN